MKASLTALIGRSPGFGVDQTSQASVAFSYSPTGEMSSGLSTGDATNHWFEISTTRGAATLIRDAVDRRLDPREYSYVRT